MKILYAVWELDPFIKVGGLGDVARSLPGSLRKHGVDIRIVIPFYTAITLRPLRKYRACVFSFSYAGQEESVTVYRVKHPITGVPVYLLRNVRYLSFPKQVDTFPFFNKAIIEMIKQKCIGWQPQIIHCNDHHTGFIPRLISIEKLPIKTVYTIHNLSHQGLYPLEILDRMGIDPVICQIRPWEIKDRQVNFMLEGLVHADRVTTVSPTYAREIMTEEYGSGMEDHLRKRRSEVIGIINGIDIEFRTSLHTLNVMNSFVTLNKTDFETQKKTVGWEHAKRLNKLDIQRTLGLTVNEKLPLFCFVGRFDPKQKGIDILHKMIRRLNLTEYQFIIIGSGNSEWEERFAWLSKFYPRSISCTFQFDEIFVNQVYASADFILVPSKFEPCGLVEMIAMFFGTIPIAHATGGLKDVITDGVDGFLFNEYSSEMLEKALKRAVNVWRDDRPHYRKMVKCALKKEFSWDKSAEKYLEVYRKLIE